MVLEPKRADRSTSVEFVKFWVSVDRFGATDCGEDPTPGDDDDDPIDDDDAYKGVTF